MIATATSSPARGCRVTRRRRPAAGRGAARRADIRPDTIENGPIRSGAMSLGARIRAVVRRSRPISVGERWSSYLTNVEPGLMALPRVHRFAAVPVIGEATLEPAPLAVWIEDGDDAASTRDALAKAKPAPVAVLDGPLADALGRCRAAHVLLMRAGDLPAPSAIERFGQAASLAPDANLITCDED